MGPSPLQIIIVVGILLLLFGATRIADVGQGLGEAIRNFKRGLKGEADAAAKPKQLADGEKSDGEKSEERESKKES